MASSVFLDLGDQGGPFSGQMLGPAADNTATPPYSFAGDSDTGYASSALDTLSLMAGGVNRFEVSTTATYTRSALGTTSTNGVIVRNATAATSGVTVQISPRLVWRGTAWDTSASETVDFFAETLPATAATPTGTWKLGYSLNAAAASYPLTVTSVGNGVLLGGWTQGAGSGFIWSGRVQQSAPGVGQMVLDDLASHGIGLDFSTDGILGIRTRAQTGNSQLYAASVRGVAVTVANLPATPVEGMLVAVTDSTTTTWGATIAGSSTNHVLAFFNGTNWTVAGK